MKFLENNRRNVNLFDILVDQDPGKVFWAIILGVLAGLSFSLIIPLILLSLQFEEAALVKQDSSPFYIGNFQITTPKLALCYFLVCIFILITRSASTILLNHVTIDATVNLRKYLYRRIALVPIQNLEWIGPSKLLAVLTQDVPLLVAGAGAFPTIVVNLSTLVGLLAFLIYLNIHVFLFIIMMILFGIVTYRFPLFFGQRFLRRSRESYDSIQEGIRSLLYGAKELKLNYKKSRAFFEQEMWVSERNYRSDQKKGTLLMVIAATYGGLISFFSIGVVAYMMANFYDLSVESLAGIVITILYISGPILVLQNCMLPIIRAKIALNTMMSLLNQMPLERSEEIDEVTDCKQLRLESVKYRYSSPSGSDGDFELGPINLRLNSGEVVFIVGGNGSGKTTLGKLLSLHYMPDEGNIYFDGEKVTDSNREKYRQNISAIFSDFHLFTRVLGISSQDVDEAASIYLEELKLSHKVSIQNGRFSTTSLSDGQRKRLALLVAYLENRNMYIFDEWAADQDPEFKKIFYNQILPNLKESGKIIIVISHDDRYFHLADKLIKLEDGKFFGFDN